MADVLMVGLVLAFFGLAVLLVRACDAVIGPDPGQPPRPDHVVDLEAGDPEPVAS